MRSRRFYLELLVSAGLMALVLWRARFWDLPDAFALIDWFTPAAVVALNIPVLALWALRSHLVLVRLGHRLPVGSLLLVTTLGNVAGTVTPAGVGDLLRSSALKDKHGLQRSSALSAVLYERLYLPILLVFAIAVAAAVQALPDDLWAAPPVIAAGLVVAAGGGQFYTLGSAIIRSTPKSWRDGFGRRSGWLRSLEDVDQTLRSLFSDFRLNLAFSSITGIVYCLTALQVYLLIEALGSDISLMEAWIAFAIASLASLILTVPGGLGIFDAGVPAVLSTRGVDFTSATAGTLLLRGCQTLPLGLLAVCCYLLISRQDQTVFSNEGERTPESEYSG